MKILTISNLYPRPDQPQRGIFNAQLFSAMAEQLSAIGNRKSEIGNSLLNICIVPEWRPWRWSGIRGWRAEDRSQESEVGSRDSEGGGRKEDRSVKTRYLPVFYLPFLGRNFSWWMYLKGLKNLKNLVMESDVVLSTWLYPDGVAATTMAAECRKPSWILVQGSDTFHLQNPQRRQVILDACAMAQGVICVCRSLADRMIEAGVDSSKVYVVPNGVNGKLFRFRGKGDASRDLGNTYLTADEGRLTRLGERKIVLFVGNLVTVKGPDILLAAWARVKARCQNEEVRGQESQLVLIGDGPLRRALESQARGLGIAASVLFLGSRPHEEVALWMNAADVLCLPSRNEGMPNVVIEALASGLPVVATDVGGVRDLLEGDGSSRIVALYGCDAKKQSEAGSQKSELNREQLAVDFAAAIEKVLELVPDRKAMAERNMDRFSWKKQAETILGLMERVKVRE